MTKSIALYADSGADHYLNGVIQNEFSARGYTITLIDSQMILNSDWEEKTALLIIPGGRDIPYHKKLQGAGNSRIHSFVKEGGSYLGICAGAYYGTAFVEFDKGQSLEVCESRELAFFPSIACGPAFGPKTFCYRTESGCRAVRLSYKSAQIAHSASLFYNGGCFFVNPEAYDNIEVLARYDELENCPAAIVKCTVGKGRALLSGVHFEQGVQGLKKANRYHQLIAKQLEASEYLRQKIFTDILFELGVA